MSIPVKYKPGTAKARQQTKMSSAAFVDTDHVRFQRDGALATIPAYSSTSLALSGSTRAIYAQRITGANAGDSYFFATHSHLYVEKNGVLFNITPLTATTQNLGTDPLTTTITESEVQLTFTDIGVDNTVGDRIKLLLLTDVGGITAATYLNAEQIITEIVDDDNIKFDCGFAATSSTTGGGSAPATIQYQIAAGNQSQVTASGMGAGDFGGGDFGGGGVSTTGVQAYPRIWSFGAFGDNVVMCPGDLTTGEGQYIYVWDGDTTSAPTQLTNSPTDCNWVAVINNSVVALCGRTVKISALGAGTVWSGLLYREKTLERVDVAVSCFAHGDRNAVIHHSTGAILLAYVGGADIWDLSDLYEDDGIIAPQACASLDESLIWRGSTGVYIYDGGIVQRIVNLLNEDWIIKNINASKVWHSFAYTDQEREEVYIHFPTGSEDEPSDYLIISSIVNAGAIGITADFTLGQMDRTAAQRPGIFKNTFYMADVADTYRHFTRGAVTFNWFAQTAFGLAGDGEIRIMLNEFRPDSNQSGDITLEIFSKEYPQSTAVSHGTWVFTSTSQVVSVKAAGRLMSFKFSGSTEATLRYWSYNFKRLGRRQGNVT